MSIHALARAGKLLCVDRGEYSDYEVTGFFVVLQDFSPRAALDEYLGAHSDQQGDYNFNQDGFLAALMAKGLLLEVEYGTLFLGSYGSHDDVKFTPACADAQIP